MPLPQNPHSSWQAYSYPKVVEEHIVGAQTCLATGRRELAELALLRALGLAERFFGTEDLALVPILELLAEAVNYGSAGERRAAELRERVEEIRRAAAVEKAWTLLRPTVN